MYSPRSASPLCNFPRQNNGGGQRTERKGPREGSRDREEEPWRVHVCGADPSPREVCDRMKKLLPFSPSLSLSLLSSTLFPSTPSVPPAVSSCGAPPSAVTLLGRPPAVHAVGLTPVSQSLARSVGWTALKPRVRRTNGRTDRQNCVALWPW